MFQSAGGICHYQRGSGKVLFYLLIGIIAFLAMLTVKFQAHDVESVTAETEGSVADGYSRDVAIMTVPDISAGTASRNTTSDDSVRKTAGNIQSHDSGSRRIARSTSASRSSGNKLPITTDESGEATRGVTSRDRNTEVSSTVKAGIAGVRVSGISRAQDSSAAASTEAAGIVQEAAEQSVVPDTALQIPDAESQLAAEQPWPTPDCPMELPQGSSDVDARTMQANYGCRYMHYCRLVNDGSNDAYCWYGFYSSPPLQI